MLQAILFVGLAAYVPQHTQATLTKGSIVLPANKIVFLTKFCFDFDPTGKHAGHWRFDFPDAAPKKGDLQLAIFDDQADSYPDENAMWDFQCGSDRLKKATKYERIVNVTALPWTLTVPLSERLRPRWWYAAVVDCSGIDRVLDFSLHMTNPRKGWQEEFSMDKCGLIPLVLVFNVYVVMAFAQQHAITLQTETARHPLRLMLFVTIAAACLGMLAAVLDGIWFAIHGQSLVFLYMSGKTLKAFSKFLLASMLMLLSNGICISQPLRVKDLWRAARLLVPFFASCLLLELWGEYAQSRTYTTGFVYCTWFGGALVVADLCLLAAYSKNVFTSYMGEDDEDRRRFYRCWAILYSGAFIILPLATLLSFALAPWVRAEAMMLLTNGVHAALLASLVLGLWPEREQTFFCLDSKDLAKTIGIKSDLLSQDIADASPCLRARTPKAMCAVPLSGIDNPFSLAKEDCLP